MWYVFFAILLVILIALAIVFYLRDKRYIRKSVTETMGSDLWDEISKEHENAYSRRRRFRKTLIEKLRGRE